MTATIDPLFLTGSRPAARRVRPVGSTSAQRPRLVVQHGSVFRRRRMAVVAGTVFSLASLVLATGAFASDPSPSNLRTIPRTYVVQSGDTIWSIARTLVPQGNIAELVDELARMNGVDLEVGQTVRIP